MSFFKNLLSKTLFPKVTIPSRQQLEKDFTEFPPKPLTSDNVENSSLSIIAPRFFFRNLYLLLSLFVTGRGLLNEGLSDQSAVGYDDDRVKTSLRKLLSMHRAAKLEMREGWKRYAESVRKSEPFNSRFWLVKYGYVFFVALLLLFVIPFLFILLTGKMVFSAIKGMRKISKQMSATAGYSLNFKGKSNEIVVHKPLFGKTTSLSINAIISHEHLHILQSKVSAKHFFSRRRHESKHRILSFINPNKEYTEHVLYLLYRDEVEARLHEVVLAMYRRIRELPLDRKTFIFRLMQCRQLHPLFVDTSIADPNKLLSKSSLEPFDLRDNYAANDLLDMTHALSYTGNDARFVMEVLPMMYANLLMIYGDEEASQEFHSSIPGPNLYHRMYC